MLEKMDELLQPAVLEARSPDSPPKAARSKNASQPSDMGEGLEHAYVSAVTNRQRSVHTDGVECWPIGRRTSRYKSLQDGISRGYRKLDVPVSDIQADGPVCAMASYRAHVIWSAYTAGMLWSAVHDTTVYTCQYTSTHMAEGINA